MDDARPGSVARRKNADASASVDHIRHDDDPELAVGAGSPSAEFASRIPEVTELWALVTASGPAGPLEAPEG